MRFERAHISAMSGYTPGEQPRDPNIIKLNTNENPYPPSPAVAEALRNFDHGRLRKYPEPSSKLLREAIAGRLGLDDSQVLVTNGGDELLRIVMSTFCEPGSWIFSTEPTYSLYPVLAGLQDCRFKSLPLEQDLSLPKKMVEQAQALNASLVLLVNPHAPTGHLFSLAELADLAQRLTGILLIDEAYVDFVDPEKGHSMLELIERCRNVILLRTFSKAYALAGLRVGFGLGSASLIEPMIKVRDSFNLDALAQSLGLAAWQDEAYTRGRVNEIREERGRMTHKLRGLGFEVPDSQTNFVNAKPPSGVEPGSLCESLKDEGILVRYFARSDSVRITIGTPEDNQTLLETLAELLRCTADISQP